MRKLSMGKIAYIVIVFCAVSGVAVFAQTFTSVARFDRGDGFDGGFYPTAALVQGLDGNFFTTTYSGGTGAGGTVVEITPGGRQTELYSFCFETVTCRRGGDSPYASLLLAADGNFYGTTVAGGTHPRTEGCDGEGVSCGTLFRIDAAGTYTYLYHFCAQPNCADGGNPYAGLIQAADGNFYGTASDGGANDAACMSHSPGLQYAACGTIFKIVPGGRLTTFYSFCAETNCSDGAIPMAGLVQATNGNFYGVTSADGANNGGTIFEITPAGELTTLYSFCAQSLCADGTSPTSALIQATDGNLYGTTPSGGANGDGTLFKVTPAGEFTTLYSFCAQADCIDGSDPGAIIQATDGNLYGMTGRGGANNSSLCYDQGCGTIFKITLHGTLTTLYSFCAESGCGDGIPTATLPTIAALVQATDGNFYGTTLAGGATGGGDPDNRGFGTVFRLSMGLGPFVETVSRSGEVGGTVTILGNDLGRTTSVAFNGTAAAFTVVSSTEITATVPTGATAGFVTVTTPLATLTSNTKFRVEP
jgi:uncharacterized repeat protein (TIGR03803 family)